MVFQYTLLNLIAKQAVPDKGSISIGDTVKIAYYSAAKAHHKTKFSFAESKEFSQIDSVIGKLETAIAKITEEMSGSWSDHVRLQGLIEQQKNLRAELAEKMERWVFLHELAEKIKRQ